MHPVRRQRLFLVLFLVIGVSIAVGLVLMSLKENLNYFFAPQEVVAGEAPKGVSIRVGGMVVPGSVERATDSLKVSFVVTDNAAQIPIHFEGILPDMFAEGTGIIASGSLNDEGALMATEVLAKHDENYMPPEVQSAMEKGGHPGAGGAMKDKAAY